MAFVVEDGTGLTNANAYIDEDFFTDYFKDRNISLPSGTAGRDKRGGIVQGSSYLDRRYRDRIIGVRLRSSQSLEWPRVNAFYQDGRVVAGVPIEWKQACAELAFIALTSDLVTNPTYDSSGRVVAEKTEKVGPIMERTKYSDLGHVVGFPSYPAVEGLLRELVDEGVTLERM